MEYYYISHKNHKHVIKNTNIYNIFTMICDIMIMHNKGG